MVLSLKFKAYMKDSIQKWWDVYEEARNWALVEELMRL